METNIPLPILAGDCDSGESKRERVANPGVTVGDEGRPVKLPKIEDKGNFTTKVANFTYFFSEISTVHINLI